MRKPLLFSFFILWTLTACNKAIPYSDDQLFDLGLLGAWEISSRTVNGTPDPMVDCCEYLELLGDSILEDLSGLWFYDDGDTVQNQGTFTVDAVEGDIQFYHQNSTFTRNYVVVSYDVIYLEHHVGSTFFEEIWRRQ
mgnify:CR=1 FL=1|tara:strand:- start:2048 stop:2458 length:411 start_codon:yes stop_codon:yes gene_type:complete